MCQTTAHWQVISAGGQLTSAQLFCSTHPQVRLMLPAKRMSDLLQCTGLNTRGSASGCVELNALGTAPYIAAHVTAYLRLLLFRQLQRRAAIS